MDDLKDIEKRKENWEKAILNQKKYSNASEKPLRQIKV